MEGKQQHSIKDNYNSNWWLGLLIMIILALGLLVLFQFLRYRGHAELAQGVFLLSIAFLVTGITSWLNLLFVNKKFLQHIEEIGNKIANKINSPEMQNILNSGLIGYEYGLINTGILQDIKNTHKSEIIIKKLWIPNMFVMRTLFEKAIVERACTVKILLLCPEAVSTLSARVKTISNHTDLDSVQRRLDENFTMLGKLWDGLTDSQKKQLQVKVHDSFVSVSMVANGGKMVVGKYLNDELSTHGYHEVINGPSTPLYMNYKSHFDKEWNNAGDYDFNKTPENPENPETPDNDSKSA